MERSTATSQTVKGKDRDIDRIDEVTRRAAGHGGRARCGESPATRHWTMARLCLGNDGLNGCASAGPASNLDTATFQYQVGRRRLQHFTGHIQQLAAHFGAGGNTGSQRAGGLQRRKAFDSVDIGPIQEANGAKTCGHRLAIDMHCAGTTKSLAADCLRTRQPIGVAEHGQQAFHRITVIHPFFTIDLDPDRHAVRPRICASSVNTRPTRCGRTRKRMACVDGSCIARHF